MAASQIEREFKQAGKRAGDEFSTSMSSAMSDMDRATGQVGAQMVSGFSGHGRRAAKGFGTAFGSNLASSLPGVAGFSSAMSGYESAAGKAGAVAGRALGLAFTTAAAGLIGGVAFTLFKGFDRYRSLDATTQRLGALGKTGSEVRSIMADINSVVEGTPIALDAAAKSATQFLTGGVKEGKPLQAALTAIADAAGASGSRFEDIGLIFNQVFNKGKLQAEEMMQLNERGLNVQAALRQEYGLSGAELEKMSKDGTISFGMLVQAIDGSFAGMSQRMGNTIDGALSNMKTAVARTGANFIAAVFGDPLSTAEGPGAMAQALNNVTAKLNNLNAWVTAHKGDIKEAFDQGVDAVQDLAAALGWVIDKVGKIPGGLTTVVGAFAAWKALTIGQGAIAVVNTGLTGVNTMLRTTLPASAAAGAASITAALGPVAALIAGMWAIDAPDRLNPNDPRNIQNRAERGDWGSVMLGDAWPWLRDKLGLNPTPTGTSGGGGSFATPGNGMPALPGFGLRWDPTRGWVPDDGAGPTGPLDSLFPGAAGAGGDGKEPKLPKAPVVPFDMTLPPEFANLPQTGSIFGAQSSFLDARHTLAEKTARLNQLEQSNEATADDILNARNEKIEAERDLQASQIRLHEAAVSEYEKANKQMKGLTADLGELGASLDADFGISKGLAGIAENLTKFVANLAAAPLLGKLGAVSALSPTQGGHGLMGILGAQGVFGSQYQNNQYASQASAMGPAALRPGVPVGMPSNLKDTGSVPSGPQSRTAAALIDQYFGQYLRGPIGGSRDNNTAKGTHDAGLSIDIPIGPDQTAIGDQIEAFLQANSDMLGLKYTIWRNQGKYPGGGGFQAGGHMDHIDAHFNGGTPYSASQPLPVSVQQWGPGSGGGGLADSLFQGADGRWHSRLPGWDHLIQRESGGVNQVQGPGTVDVNSGGNEAEGLFQITPGTWAAHGGTRFAPSAISATPQQQAAIAQAIFGANPSGGDWGMGLAGRENPSQLRNELSGGPGWFPPLPPGITGGGGESPVFGAGPMSPSPGLAGPGIGGAAGMIPTAPGIGSAAGTGPTRIGGIEPPSGTGSGGFGITPGGTIDTAIGLAASGLDIMAPGAGQAAQTGIKLANRAIQFGGQVAGIGMQGLMQTFLPTGASELANNNWATRLIGAAAGAAPALPNLAGKSASTEPLQPNQVDPNTQQHGQGQGQPPGPITVNYEANNQTEDRSGADLTWHLGNMHAAPGM